MKLSLGIDFGTSGARGIAIDIDRNICWSGRVSYGAPKIASSWFEALDQLLGQLPPGVASRIDRLALDGTSGTVVLCDGEGQTLGPALMYNDDRGQQYLELAQGLAPPGHSTLSATSGLMKLLWYSQQDYFDRGRYLLPQADWLAASLHGQWGHSDYHNALKLGYDPVALAYPSWWQNSNYGRLLPLVHPPASPLAPILPAVASRYGFPRDCWIYTGTTDSVAAFAATGAKHLGEAVTSLGSTLVLKLLSKQPIHSPAHGVYSHRWGDLWLAGGASNSGGAVLAHFFTPEQLATLSGAIAASALPNSQFSSQLDYYPLLQPGERFPIADPLYPPRLAPRPPSDPEFLRELLWGLTRIEAQGYELLQDLGAAPLTRVFTAGGGAQNQLWQALRCQALVIPVIAAQYQEAAYGVARMLWG